MLIPAADTIWEFRRVVAFEHDLHSFVEGFVAATPLFALNPASALNVAAQHVEDSGDMRGIFAYRVPVPTRLSSAAAP
jgi:hypothetical protein